MAARVLPALLLFLASGLSRPDVLDISRVKEKTLENGLRVIVKHEPYWGLVAAGLFVRAGSVHNPEGKQGLSHVVEHLLFETTSPQQPGIGRTLEDMGGYINAESLHDFTSVQWLVASKHFEKALGAVASRLKGRDISREQLDAEKQVVEREIADRLNDIAEIAEQQLWMTAYREHPYRWEIGGTRESLKQITAADVKNFMEQFYVANNMALVVVGDVEPEEVFDVAQRRLQDLPKGEIPWKEPPREKWPGEVRWRTVEEQARGAAVAIGFPAPGMDNKRDVCAMDLIYTLLGEEPIGWLQNTLVREKKLALQAECEFLTRRYPGLFIIRAICTPSKDLSVREAVLAKIRELRQRPVSQAELDTAKTVLATSWAFTNETYLDQVGSIGFYEMIDTYKFAFDYLDLVRTITPEQVQEVARKYLDPDAYAGVTVRPQQSGEQEAMIPWPLG